MEPRFTPRTSHCCDVMVWCCSARRAQGERACRRCALASTCPIRRRNAEVLRHLPLAMHTAERYFRSAGCRGGADRDDLRSEAALGLIASVEGFDPAAGHRFSSYAVPKVLGTLRHHQRDRWQALHMPRRLLELQQRVRTLQRRRQEQGLVPLPSEELCRELHCTAQQLEQAALAWQLQHVVSLHGFNAGDLIAARDPAESDLPLHWLRQALALLPPSDQQLLAAAWIDLMPRRSLAEQLGVSCQALNRRLNHLLTQLRQSAMASSAAMVV